MWVETLSRSFRGKTELIIFADRTLFCQAHLPAYPFAFTNLPRHIMLWKYYPCMMWSDSSKFNMSRVRLKFSNSAKYYSWGILRVIQRKSHLFLFPKSNSECLWTCEWYGILFTLRKHQQFASFSHVISNQFSISAQNNKSITCPCQILITSLRYPLTKTNILPWGLRPYRGITHGENIL